MSRMQTAVAEKRATVEAQQMAALVEIHLHHQNVQRSRKTLSLSCFSWLVVFESFDKLSVYGAADGIFAC